MSGGVNCPVVVLSSGHSLRLRKVMLYDEQAVAEVAELRAQAAKGLGSSGVGLGVLGTPSVGFALEAGALLAVSGLLASVVQKTALDFLRRAQEKSAALANNGVYFDSSALNDTRTPRPAAWWCCDGTRWEKVDLSAKSRTEVDSFLRTHNLQKSDLVGWTTQIKVPRRYVHNGDEFINVTTDVGEMSIRWSEVVSYYPPQAIAHQVAAQ